MGVPRLDLRSARVGIVSPVITRATIDNGFLSYKECLVYRLLAADGSLLYVGMTENPLNRWQAHATTKSWWPDVAAIYYEAGLTRWQAAHIEHVAIHRDNPVHNGEPSK